VPCRSPRLARLSSVHEISGVQGSDHHVNQRRFLLCRLARLRWCPSSQGFPHSQGCSQLSTTDARADRRVKKSAAHPLTVAQAVTGYLEARPRDQHIKAAGHALIAAAGYLPVSSLTPGVLVELVLSFRDTRSRTTAYVVRAALRRIVRHLEVYGHIRSGLSDCLPKLPSPLPRLTTATDEERARLLSFADLPMKFFIHLCADLGLRHRSASLLALKHWDVETNSITFPTKGDKVHTLPLTADLLAILRTLPPDADPSTPIMQLLTRKHYRRSGYMWARWKGLLKRAGVTRDLHIHDLRRSAAEAIWSATHDLRQCQAVLGHSSVSTTAGYLANRVNADRLRDSLRASTARRNAVASPSAAAPVIQ